MAGTTRQKLHL